MFRLCRAMLPAMEAEPDEDEPEVGPPPVDVDCPFEFAFEADFSQLDETIPNRS